MKLLLYDMGAYTQQDMMETLCFMGISCKNVLYKLADKYEDAYFIKCMKELMEKESYDAILSVNYYPILAGLCADFGILYLSWSYDSPLMIRDIEKTLGYPTNYVFLFDRRECEKYRRKGFTNVYHLPLAVSVKRLDSIVLSREDKENYKADVSMVGQLYNSSLPVLLTPLSEYEKGYISAVLETQMRLYGSYFLEELVNEELMERIQKSYRTLGENAVLPTKEGLLLEMVKYIAHFERTFLLDELGREHFVCLYGPDKPEEASKVIWHGSAGYFEEMPKVFKASKINLNVSLKCIQSGIPLRALDIMGAGGFLLTNYQSEIAESFVDGEEVVMYTSMEDALEKCSYYISHEEERREIAKRGHEKVKALFSYEERLRTMLETAGLL